MRIRVLGLIGTLAALPLVAQLSSPLMSTPFLKSGQSMSNNGFTLTLGGDGNLCEYLGSGATRETVWCSGVVGGATGHYAAALTADGNFCVWPGDAPGGTSTGALWCENRPIGGPSPSFLTLNGDGNLFVQAGTPQAPTSSILWQTGIVYSTVVVKQPSTGTIKWSTADNAVCPPTCSKVLKVNSVVNLTAQTPVGNLSVFREWSPAGVCADSKANPCAEAVTATSWSNTLEALYDPSATYAAPSSAVDEIETPIPAGSVISFSPYPNRATPMLWLKAGADANASRWVARKDGTLRLASDLSQCLTAGLINATQQNEFKVIYGSVDASALSANACGSGAQQQFTFAQASGPSGTYTLIRSPQIAGCAKVAGKVPYAYLKWSNPCVFDDPAALNDPSRKADFDRSGFVMTP